MTALATTADALPAPASSPRRASRWATSLALTLIPVGLALVACGVILAGLGVDPIAFYRDMVTASVVRTSGLYDSIARMAPILLISCGLIVVFRANLWNLGMDGQYLLAAAFVAGLGPWLMTQVPVIVGWIVLSLVAMAIGAAWTIIPAWLKSRFGINEIVTTLMMSFIGVGLAVVLVKGPFDGPGGTPQTDVLPPEAMLADIPGTNVHIGVIVALLVCLITYLVFARTSFGTRLDVLGANPRAAVHLGIDVTRLIIVAFLISGALIGLAAAVDIQGIFAYMRSDWNPSYGLAVVPLVFLARLNALAIIPFAAFFSLLSIGGLYATRRADLPSDFGLLFTGLMLLFMVGIQYLYDRRSRARDSVVRRTRRSAEDD
ncbi:MAG TPA: ABC transporter permease [Candidatus Limnocylindrales bacterium]|nr:ABC transporter permease [Candidatus Limnocylindrales bacterium]